VLIVANVAVLALIAGSGAAVGYLTYEYKQIKRVVVPGLTVEAPDSSKAKPTDRYHHPTNFKPAFTVLIIGSDSRADASKLGVNVGNTASQSENLSDAIVLARVSPSTHQVALLSIPRDLVVNVPGMGEARINAAFSGGDPGRLVEVIHKDLGIPVNHYAAVNFSAVEEIANAIGGVEQYFPTPAQDLHSNLTVTKAGCVDLTGAQALAFVRSRDYQYFLDGEWQFQEQPESDLGRIQRQQAFIRDGVEKAERSGALGDPLTLRRIVSSVATNLTLDKTFSVSDLLGLADAFRHIDATRIPSVTLSAVNAVENGSDVLMPSPAADAAEIKAFLAIGTTTAKKVRKPTTTTTKVPTTKVPTTTTTAPVDGSPYQSATAIIASSSSYVDNGVYIPPGREPAQKVSTCGN
jgi:LCP family protein required for cell wall assembly